jgi:hypothetical protein
MPEPRIKRYALVPSAREDGIKRFHLARIAERLERMEEVAAREASACSCSSSSSCPCCRPRTST